MGDTPARGVGRRRELDHGRLLARPAAGDAGAEAIARLREFLGDGGEQLVPISPGTRLNAGDGIRMAIEQGARTSGDWNGMHAEPVDAPIPVATADSAIDRPFASDSWPDAIGRSVWTWSVTSVPAGAYTSPLSGSAPEAITVGVRAAVPGFRVEVGDRGSGLSASALRDALLAVGPGQRVPGAGVSGLWGTGFSLPGFAFWSGLGPAGARPSLMVGAGEGAGTGAGGGGFLGGAIVRMLTARGDAVRVLARGDYPALRELGVETAKGEVRGAAVTMVTKSGSSGALVLPEARGRGAG